MDLEFRTLAGEKNGEKFMQEWQNSEDMDATFVEDKNGIFYILPYGKYNSDFRYDLEKKGKGSLPEKWKSPYKSHEFLVNDFGLERESIIGGGYLRLNSEDDETWRKPFFHFGTQSKDFGYSPNKDELRLLMLGEFFDDNI